MGLTIMPWTENHGRSSARPVNDGPYRIIDLGDGTAMLQLDVDVSWSTVFQIIYALDRSTSGKSDKLTSCFEQLIEEHGRALCNGERYVCDLIEALPMAIYTTDAEGRITSYNQAAVAFAGCRPRLRQDRWCITWRLYSPNGTPLLHDQCPMATALKENRPVRGVEAVAERPDGTCVSFTPFPTPLRDASGALIGGVNMLLETTQCS
jgi:PAS domain-containing protein